MGENHFGAWPVAFYGVVLLGAAVAYYILVQALLHTRHKNEQLMIAISKDFKGRVSLLFYLIGIALAVVNVWISCACYVEVAIMWLIPDRRIEQQANYK